MADKISTNEAISRVYQFLNLNENRNWKTEADSNHDHVIIKDEFTGFLNNKGFNENDIISKFWDSIDVNATGTAGWGTKISNQNAIDIKELTTMECNLIATDNIRTYVQKKGLPPVEVGNYSNRWQDVVIGDILNQASKMFSNIDPKLSEDRKKEEVEKILDAHIEELYYNASTKASADLAAWNRADQIPNGKVDGTSADFSDYQTDEDSRLKSLIDKIIADIPAYDPEKNNAEEIAAIAKDAHDTIEAYEASAIFTEKADGTIEFAITNDQIKKLNDHSYYLTELNPLQKQTLVNYFGTKIAGEKETDQTCRELLGSDFTWDFYKEFKTKIDEIIAGIVSKSGTFQEILTAKKDSTLNKINEALTDLREDYKKLITNRKNGIKETNTQWNNTGDEYNQERRDAIRTVLSLDPNASMSDVAKAIAVLEQGEGVEESKNLDTIMNTIRTKMHEFDVKLPKNFLDQLPSTLSAVQGGNNHYMQLTNSYSGNEHNTYEPGQLHFRNANNCSAIEVGEAGAISIKTDAAPGQYTAKIEVVNDEGLVVAGPKTVVVNIAKQLNLSEDNGATFNGQTMSFILANPAENAIQLSGFTTWEAAKTNAKNSIDSYVDNIKGTLAGYGYDANQLDIAARNTKAYFKGIIDHIDDHISSSGDGMQDVIFNYVDSNQQTHSEKTQFSQYTRHREADAGRNDWGAKQISQDSCGIRMNESYAGTNTYEYYLNSAILLKKFQEFFNRM